MGPGVDVTSVFPLKESLREMVVELAQELQPYLPDIDQRWRERMAAELPSARILTTLERVTLSAGCSYFVHGDFNGFFENLYYFGARLAKLQIDTRLIRRALDLYIELCTPYLSSLFTDREDQADAALEMLASASFVAVSGAYFDVRTLESSALLSILDAELVDGPLDKMLQRVLEITCETFQANSGAVLLREADTNLLRVEAEVGLGEELRGEFSVAMGQGFSGHVARTGEAEMVMDVSRDRRIVNDVLRLKAKALWGMPLKFDGKTIGVLVAGFARPYEWLPTERELFRAIADRSALAIQRSRITQTLREREERIVELSGHLLQAQEEERARISRELHDETGQGLMVIRLYLGMLEASLPSRTSRAKVKETLEVVDRTIVGIRRIIGKLSPLVLQELGLFAAVRKEAALLEQNSGVQTRVAISDSVGRLSQETETAIYRIVQEALHNISKHAKAQNAGITMDRQDGSVVLRVEDDGIGIFPKSNFRGNSFGLAGIKERVSMLGGEVRVVSLKGKGTCIELTVPATEPDIRNKDAAAAAAEIAYAHEKIS
jgi:signal transduction histidine kinase